MEHRLSGNKRLVYQELCTRGGGKISYGALAYMCGCHRQTVKRLVHELATQGLISYRPGRGRPNCYDIV